MFNCKIDIDNNIFDVNYNYFSSYYKSENNEAIKVLRFSDIVVQNIDSLIHVISTSNNTKVLINDDEYIARSILLASNYGMSPIGNEYRSDKQEILTLEIYTKYTA